MLKPQRLYVTTRTKINIYYKNFSKVFNGNLDKENNCNLYQNIFLKSLSK